MGPAYFIKDKLVMTSDGDVIDFDLEVIEAALKEVAERKSFFERNCQPLGANPCSLCKMGACPMADRGKKIRRSLRFVFFNFF